MGEHVYNNRLHPNDLDERDNELPSIGDPPYVYGDHAATCVGPYGWGCEQCNPSHEDEDPPYDDDPVDYIGDEYD